MSENFVLRCRVCHDPIGKPHLCLDRRTLYQSNGIHDGKVMPIVTVMTAQEMFRYDSNDCCDSHEAQVIAELQLAAPYPNSSSLMVPCSRCGATVDRSLRHVSYVYLLEELDMTNFVATVLDETELAVLCRDCEEPDGQQDAAAENTKLTERSTA